MDAVNVPLYRAAESNSIADVLTALRSQGRGGIVIENGNDYRVFYAGDLLRALNAGQANVQQVGGGESVELLDNSHVIAYGLDLVRPMQAQTQYQNMFASIANQFALFGATDQDAMVVTQSESLTQALLVPGAYQCDGTPTHTYPYPSVSKGEECTQYHSSAGMATINPAP